MSKSEVMAITVQLDAGEVEKCAEAISIVLDGLDKMVNNLEVQIQNIFTKALNVVDCLIVGVDELSECFKTVAEWDFSGVLTELTEISDTLDLILEKLNEPDWVGIGSLILQGLDFKSNNGGSGKNVFGGYKGKYESGKITGVGGYKGKYTANHGTDSVGIVAGGMGLMDGSLSSAFDDIATKLKNSAAATWLQNAATTAWQGISTAATAVTTAFGAAMTFLTSPIGLVVIGIVALIAIIVLLIANWDTVKAAVLTAWDAIVAALSTAAEWFNTNIIQPIVGFFTGLWTSITGIVSNIWNEIVSISTGIAQWVQDNVLQPIVGFFTDAMDWISSKVHEGFAFVQGIFAGVNEFLQGIFAKDWTEQFGAFGNVLNAFFANVENIWNAIKNIFSNIVSFVKNVFAGDWGAAWDSIVNVFKGIWDYLVAIVKAPINGIIGLINGLVQGVVDGINLVIGALNGISFDIPDWVPLIGGQTFGFNLALLNAPKIPLLAKGAVLPANRPFLAMVGDQRHGTNIEAPLATIQEAVALVMEDQFAGMMAGFEASVGVQKQILQAVLGIEIGDTTIGQAAARYNTKMAIIRGGM